MIYKCSSPKEQEEKFKWLYDYTNMPIYYFEYSRHYNTQFNYKDKSVHWGSYPSISLSGDAHNGVFCGSASELDESTRDWPTFVNYYKSKGVRLKPLKLYTHIKKHTFKKI
jgi:hypothetical protein